MDKEIEKELKDINSKLDILLKRIEKIEETINKVSWQVVWTPAKDEEDGSWRQPEKEGF